MTFIEFLEKWSAIILAAISINIAIVSLFKASKAQKIQNKVNELELKIKKFEVEKINKLKEEENTSCVEARIIRISNGNRKIKIWNSGKTTVKNVIATIPPEAEVYILQQKMPYEVLEPNKSFEEFVITHGGSKSKFIITTEWEDMNGKVQKKEQMGDI